MSDRKKPSGGPPEQPSVPPSGPPSVKRPGTENVTPGLKPGQERGPDGRIRKAAVEESIPDNLEVSLFDDMRHVRRFPVSADRTEGQRDARKWKEGDLDGFMRRYADLEKVWAATHQQTPASNGAP